MSKLLALKGCTSASDVAHLIDFQPKALGYVSWGTKGRYSAFDIPKRSGGRRTIHAPIPQLKLAQRKLSDLLQECEQEIEASLGVRRRLSHGFRKGHSIMTNADVHRNQKYVLNFDLEDFFGTINFGRVRGFFITNKHFSLAPDVATLIAQIACHNSKLPQGAPTSPVISNLIGNILDMRLVKLARAHGCSYSRYADDITFSTSTPEFPPAIAGEAAPNDWMLSKDVLHAVHASGFTINPSKTRMAYRRSRQEVTGIVVNKVVNVNADYRRRVRVMVHHLCSTGDFHRANATISATGVTSVFKETGTRPQLQGMISFLQQAEAFRRGASPLPLKLSAIEKLNRRFLFYTRFASPDMPMLVFEGKTDSVYLNAAIRNLAPAYPALANKAGLLVQLLRQTKTIERLFGLSGGAKPLINFIKEYHDEYRHIQGPKGSRPIIAIFDNDSVAPGVMNMISGIKKTAPVAGTQVVRVFDNLYVMLTTPLGHPSHCIEDCFDPAFVTSALGGKTINFTSNANKANEVSKSYFAEQIVRPNWKTIDFSGFKPLLDQIVKVIDAHTA
ncbi:retron Ec67 family RNA-directed DNA polymerase/endonuclease [Stenotrophomonas indicatrix]|nr:retron Ec67 family RNA-directed DNA polymerase/endonuclease [Stenotrophomonas maltophilia]HDS1041924.1 retron Ec67 family RNA-directed DNA polymerase/endonuclease [Stenotrophomonas maltophilia]